MYYIYYIYIYIFIYNTHIWKLAEHLDLIQSDQVAELRPAMHEKRLLSCYRSLCTTIW